jgi:hypothetical protein
VQKNKSNQDRREFLQTSLGASAIAASAACFGPLVDSAWSETRQREQAKADSCIFIWLGGGACHIDTWDPKQKGDATQKNKKPGSYYDALPTAIKGVQVCEHLPHMANLLDRCAIVRSVNHDVIDEHAAAVNRLHVGRPPTGTTTYPSIGSVMSHKLGARGEGVPSYVLMGYPSTSRGPGFLGAKHSFVYLTDTTAGPAGLKRPADVTAERESRRQQLLSRLRDDYSKANKDDKKITNYVTTSVAGLRLAGPKFMSVFDLHSESDTLRNAYGDEFGQRCLLARRLVESGVRFVEVAFNLNFINGTGWDTHNQGQKNQHILIQQLDQALSTLINDLEKRGRLDKTLIVVATEFGRPPEFDGGGGRGHHSKAFSVVLAGGGLKTGQAVGVTDDLGRNILERPVSVADLHATIYSAMGVDPAEDLYDGDRPVPITDRGKPVSELFS